MAEFPSLNDELRSLTNREFPNYIPVPSLAESSGFDILGFCSPMSAKNQSLFRKVMSWSSSNQADSDTGSSPNLKSLGHLFEYCPGNKNEVKTKEEPVFIHGQASNSQVCGGTQVDVLPVAGCDGSASLKKKNVLNLGKIFKRSLPYKQISYWLKRVTRQISPELFREAKKGRLYIIYEVLTAEHLTIKAEENSNIEGSMSVKVPKSGVGVKGSGNLRRNKDLRFARPKKMGRYNFAYKCGRVRIKKNKTHLVLVGLYEFYEPFQVRPQDEPFTSDQSQSPPDEDTNQ